MHPSKIRISFVIPMFIVLRIGIIGTVRAIFLGRFGRIVLSIGYPYSAFKTLLIRKEIRWFRSNGSRGRQTKERN